MITKEQLAKLSKFYKINETTIFREYLQLLFLSRLYSLAKAKKIFFKGGTALHFIYKAPRFSEDLDFTVEEKQEIFYKVIKDVFKKFTKEESVEFKEKKTIAGKRFLLTSKPLILTYQVFVSLDFSFREKVLKPKKSIIKTNYPVLFNSYIYHLSKEEIVAEKIRAVLTRKKGRDLYDLWFLLNKKVSLDSKLIKQKLKYYNLKNITRKDIINRVKQFSEKDFILDLRPFVSVDQREKLGSFFIYLKDFLNENL